MRIDPENNIPYYNKKKKFNMTTYYWVEKRNLKMIIESNDHQNNVFLQKSNFFYKTGFFLLPLIILHVLLGTSYANFSQEYSNVINDST